MGEVWKAKDTTLDREVAVKILPALFASDPDRLARFEREAKVLASLNHPNIAAVYGLHDAGGVRFLAMELVPGEDLSQRLERGRLDVAEAKDVARQIAAGLDAAHANGVVHRDLKPANVQRTPDGTVKVLDFGLAKALENVGGDVRQSMTMTSAGSVAGMILGTAAYMSPEQARAQMVDRRTDLWAFGCVLYEMLSGKKAFDGPTITDVLAAVVTREPDWSALPAGTPSSVRRLLHRCLEKDLKKRLRDAGDASLLLDDDPEDASGGGLVSQPAAAAAPAWRRALPWALAAVLAAALAAVVVIDRGSSPAESSPMVLSVKLPLDTKLDVETNQGEYQILAISRDGALMAFVAGTPTARQLYIRAIDHLEATLVPRSEGASAPFFSPDGHGIGFFARGKLKKASVDGGDPIDLADSGVPRGGVWCDDDTIVFSPTTTSGLLRVSSGGGTPAALTTPDTARQERTHRWPALLPNGEVAFTVGTADKSGTYEDSRIDAVALASGQRRTLVVGASIVRYAASGHLLLGRNGQIFAVRLEDAKGGPVTNPRPVVQGVEGIATSGVVFFDVANNGTLIYVERDPGAKELQLVRVGHDGKVDPLPFPPREYRAPRISPDGKRVAVGVGAGRGGESDVWIGNLASGEMSRLTFGATSGTSSSPIWSRDGHDIIFGMSEPGGRDVLALKPADGSANERVLGAFPLASARGPSSLSPDGKYLVYQVEGGAGHSTDVMLLSVADGTSSPIAVSPAIEIGGVLSPDGRWLAYSSDETGQAEVYVRPFRGSEARWQLSEGGSNPQWSTDGKFLYYVDLDARLAEVPVQAGAGFSYGRPKVLFETRFPTTSDTFTNFDPTPDGRFVMVRTTSAMRTAEHIDVIVNFFDILKGAGR